MVWRISSGQQHTSTSLDKCATTDKPKSRSPGRLFFRTAQCLVFFRIFSGWQNASYSLGKRAAVKNRRAEVQAIFFQLFNSRTSSTIGKIQKPLHALWFGASHLIKPVARLIVTRQARCSRKTNGAEVQAVIFLSFPKSALQLARFKHPSTRRLVVWRISSGWQHVSSSFTRQVRQTKN